MACAWDYQIREVEIEEDGSGRADIGPAEHLPLVDQIAVCVAGIEAQELVNCPMHDHAALGDYRKVRGLLAGLTETESHEYLHAGYLRALEILKGQLPEIEKLADQLLNPGASRPNMPDILMGFLIGCALGLGVGYAVRERVSRQRRRRHRERSIY